MDHYKHRRPSPDLAGGSSAKASFDAASPGSAKKPRLSPCAAAAASTQAILVGEPMMEEGSPLREPSTGAVDNGDEEKTPSQQQVSTPRAPAAPSKSGGSSYNRMQPSPAVRSLTQLFNGCTGAVERARQMGGQFAVRRRNSQRPAAGSGAAHASTASTPAAVSGLRRTRSVLGELLQSPPLAASGRSDPSPTPQSQARAPTRAKYVPDIQGMQGSRPSPMPATGFEVTAATAADPRSPAPARNSTALRVHSGSVTSYLVGASAGEEDPMSQGAAGVQARAARGGRTKPPPLLMHQQQPPRRPPGRPVGHAVGAVPSTAGAEQGGEAGPGQAGGAACWLKSATYKLR